MPKTLYITDLDGTLLNSAQRVSPRSCEIIDRLTESGLLLTCATARSRISAGRALDGLHLRLPMIVYNGTFIQESDTSKVLHGCFLSKSTAESIINWYIAHDLLPIVYAFVDGKEHFSYVPERSSKALLDFVATRPGDPRTRITDAEGLKAGDIFYITAMGNEELLQEARCKFMQNEELNTIFYREIYSGNYWLEFMPEAASKAHAALRLKELLGCDRLVCFGDAVNDIPMFRIADEAYATANADPQLKEIATGVIGSNEEDAVALWLEQYGEF